jgi:hypothetical protein
MALRDAAPPAGGQAGWYPDPLGSPSSRYFDGTGWTDRIGGSNNSRVAARPKPRKLWFLPRWRKMTWTIVIFSALMLLWVIVGASSANNAQHCANESSQFLSQADCTSARDAGTAIGVGLLIFLWFLGFVVLSLIWFMTRPKGRDCPACGETVKKGRTVCPSCQFDFAAAVGHEPGMAT